MNLRANEKTKKYQFLFSDGDEDVKRFFFPIVVTTDGTLHNNPTQVRIRLHQLCD
jgi:hypothetical protein